MDRFMSVMVVVLMVVVLLIGGLAAFRMFGPKMDCGTVYAKKYFPASTSLIPMQVGKVTIMQTIVYPERWAVYIHQDEMKDEYWVSKKRFDEIEIGEWLEFGEGFSRSEPKSKKGER